MYLAGFASDIDGNRRPIAIQNLKEYYIRMHADDNRLFSDEYKVVYYVHAVKTLQTASNIFFCLHDQQPRKMS